MNIFNSLGSNYSFKFAMDALFTQDQKKYSDELIQLLEKKFNGKAILFYKGREALKSAFELSEVPKDSYVAINGFTCWAVYEAIISAGYKVDYLDIEDKGLNFTPKILEEKLKKNPQIKIVLVQNTLGYPCQISAIEKTCRASRVVLIEDLAHCVGSLYEDEREAGTIGDLVILSFSQDKIIDGISGGALVIRNRKYQKGKSLAPQNLNTGNQYKDRFYPIFTYVIRSTYTIKLGKVLHSIFKELNLLSKPIEKENIDQIHRLSSWYCSLIKFRFEKLSSDLRHRKTIASVYAKNLNKNILSLEIVKQISFSSNLRFPIFVKKRSGLIQFLKENNIFVSDIWYDAPIAPKRYLHLTNYKNQCPNAEIISNQILNLPTHQNISESQADKICQKINEWLRSQ